MTSGESHAKLHHGVWITLLMLYVLFFTAGMGIYTHQVYVPRLEEAFGWSRFQTVGPTALWAVVYGLSGFLVGTWIQRFGARKVFLAGVVSGAAAFLLTLMINHPWELWGVMIVTGVAVSASTLVPAQTVITAWFNKKRGRHMGFAMMGVGIGGMVLSPLVAWVIQEVEKHWRVVPTWYEESAAS